MTPNEPVNAVATSAINVRVVPLRYSGSGSSGSTSGPRSSCRVSCMMETRLCSVRIRSSWSRRPEIDRSGVASSSCRRRLRLGRLAVALEPLGDDGPIRTQALCLTGGLEHVPAFGQRGLGPKPRVTGLGQRVAIHLRASRARPRRS